MNQAGFAAALLDPEAALPPGLVDPFGAPAPKRFSVYRNNVASSLTRALEAAFPTVRKLVGDAFFGAMAVVFLRAHPPASRMLMLYGDALPGWLEGFPPVAHLGYLPDVARLDQAMRESYHAADSPPLPEAELQRLLGEDIAGLRLALAPSLRLVRSQWPVVSIWLANHSSGPAPLARAEDALVLRPDFDPHPHPLPPGGAAFIEGLLAGKTLGESLDIAGETVDLSTTLGLLVAGRAITGVLK
jgi:Putative DNA-binding domain